MFTTINLCFTITGLNKTKVYINEIGKRKNVRDSEITG